MRIEGFEPRPHPLKAVFRNGKIRQITLARFLNISLATLSHWLNGYQEIPSDIEEKLNQLAEEMGAKSFTR